MTEKIHVVYLYADTEAEWNCSHWRCHLLSNGINYQHDKDPEGFPHTAQMILLSSALDYNHPKVQRIIGEADILVVQRNVLFKPVTDMMDYWRALGKVVLVDLDDHYPMIPPSNPAFHTWIMNVNELDPIPVDALKQGLEHADALIAPSRVLLKDWEHVLPGYYWPNYPSLLAWKDTQRRPAFAPDIVFAQVPSETGEGMELASAFREDSENKIIIGWGGSLSHIDSFVYSGVIEALERLLKEDSRVVFKFCGNERRMKEFLKELPEDQLWFQPGVPADHWPKVVTTFDIGIAPLDMRPIESGTGHEHGEYSYDERRSWLKCVEYACGGVPFVASKSATYEDFDDYGKLVENTPEEWYEALKTRTDSIVRFREQAESLRNRALKKFTIENNAKRLVEFYMRIGEEVQAKQGMTFPNLLVVEPAMDTDWSPAPDSLYEGDPMEVGYGEHGAQTQKYAKEWANGLDLVYDNMDLSYIMEYMIVSMLNTKISEGLQNND